VIDATVSNYADIAANQDTGIISVLSNLNKGTMGLIPTHHASKLLKVKEETTTPATLEP
jgi:hypothetical protein